MYKYIGKGRDRRPSGVGLLGLICRPLRVNVEEVVFGGRMEGGRLLELEQGYYLFRGGLV